MRRNSGSRFRLLSLIGLLVCLGSALAPAETGPTGGEVISPASDASPVAAETPATEAVTAPDTTGASLAPEPAEEKKADEKPKTSSFTFSKGAPVFTSADGLIQVKLGMRLHTDFRAPEAGAYQTTGTKLNSSFLVRRARANIGGSYGKSIDFLLVTDYSAGGVARFKDAWLNLKFSDAFQIMSGQHKVPFSYEWGVGSSNRWEFVERSLMFNAFNIQYDMGVSVHGLVADKKLEYWLSYFNGDGEVTFPDGNDGKDGAFRLVCYPIPGLSLGGSGTYGLQGTPKSSFRGALTTGFIYFDPVPMNGLRWRIGAEAIYLTGPASFRFEWNHENDNRDNLGTGGKDLAAIRGDGFYLSGSYFLTGEKKDDSGIQVIKPFFPMAGMSGPGAWEVVARYGMVDVKSDDVVSTKFPKGNKVQEFTVGVNWYQTMNTRLMLNFNWYKFDDELRTPFSFNTSNSKLEAASTSFWEITTRLAMYF